MKNVQWYAIWVTCYMILSLFSGISEAQLKHLDPAVRVINESGVNARSEPRTGANTLMKRVVLGTLMKRIGKRGVWYHVILPGGEKAWVHGNYVKEETARDLLEVKGRGVRVRKNASTGASIAAQLSRGQMLFLIRERNSWYQVLLPNGSRGWVHKNLVIRRPLSPPEKEEQAKLEPKPPPVDYYRKGQALVAEKQVDAAVEAFQKALEQKPNDGAIHYDLARLLRQKDDLDAALVHFRKALSMGNRSEAQFYIDEILKIQTGAMAQTEGEAIEDPLEETVLEGAWINMAYLLPGVAAGSVVFLVVLGLVFYRRRQASRMDRPVFHRRNKDDGFDTVLKYAVEKRPLLRAIEEAERKRAKMDEALQQQFVAFGQRGDGKPRLPTGESSEALLKKVEDLRQTILNQEERAQIYADLVLLQNEKLDALDEEITALKKLIQIDYQKTSKKSGKAPAKNQAKLG